MLVILLLYNLEPYVDFEEGINEIQKTDGCMLFLILEIIFRWINSVRDMGIPVFLITLIVLWFHLSPFARSYVNPLSIIFF